MFAIQRVTTLSTTARRRGAAGPKGERGRKGERGKGEAVNGGERRWPEVAGGERRRPEESGGERGATTTTGALPMVSASPSRHHRAQPSAAGQPSPPPPPPPRPLPPPVNACRMPAPLHLTDTHYFARTISFLFFYFI